MTTNTKKIREKNWNHLIRTAGGKRNFYDTTKYLAKSHTRGNVWKAVEEGVLSASYGVAYYDGMLSYCARTIPGFDKSRYYYKAGPNKGDLKTTEVEKVYLGMIGRDGARLFEQIKKEHPDW